MCGRYVFSPSKDMKDRFDLIESQQQLFDLEATFNVAPGFNEPVVVQNSPNHLELMRWGLVPPWAKDIRIGYKMINARAETLLQKSSFKKPFMNKRCIVPVSGFFEWQATSEGKEPYYIRVKNEDMFGLAGLYEIAHDAEGRELKTFTIITTSPNKFMAEIHDRMPVIIPKDKLNYWLDNSRFDQVELTALLVPYKGEMEKWRVSTRVNKVTNQDKDLISMQS